MARTTFWILVALAAQLSCSDDAINVAGGGGSGAGVTGGGNVGGGGAGGGVSGGGVTGGGGAGGIAPPTETAACQGHIYECGDLVDNDADGLLDSNDPDCLGPCDDTEDSYFGGIPGQSGPACKVDCYFDQDSGSGNDDCYWSHECDPNEVPPNYYPEPASGDACAYDGPDTVLPPTGQTCAELNATQSQACHDYCGPLTPNGCDCFGCCELPAGSGAYVWLGSEGLTGTVCSIADLANPAICHPCVPVAACLNECDPCEVCIGQPEPDPSCGEGGAGAGGGGGGSQCAPGIQECGLAGQAPCPGGFFCVTGCCIAEPR